MAAGGLAPRFHAHCPRKCRETAHLPSEMCLHQGLCRGAAAAICSTGREAWSARSRYARAKMQKENISEMPRLAPPIPMHFRTTSPERDAFSRKMAEDARVRGTVAVEVTSN